MLYTDGSVSEDWSGCGFSLKHGVNSMHAGLTMEVNAVPCIYALRWTAVWRGGS